MKCTDCKLLATPYLPRDSGWCHAPAGRGRQRLFGCAIHGLQRERQCTFFIHKDSDAPGWEYPKQRTWIHQEIDDL